MATWRKYLQASVPTVIVLIKIFYWWKSGLTPKRRIILFYFYFECNTGYELITSLLVFRWGLATINWTRDRLGVFSIIIALGLAFTVGLSGLRNEWGNYLAGKSLLSLFNQNVLGYDLSPEQLQSAPPVITRPTVFSFRVSQKCCTFANALPERWVSRTLQQCKSFALRFLQYSATELYACPFN